MRNGYTLLPSTLFTTEIWSQADLWRLLCWCLFTAVERATSVRIAGIPLRLETGQLAASLGDICRATGLAPVTVRRCLEIGKNMGLLEVRATPWWLHIYIVNWQEYQAPRRWAVCPTQRDAR